jgi:hypothetical protein
MNLKLSKIYFFILLLSTACTNNSVVKIANKNQGKLKASVKLEKIDEKKFELDTCTAPKPEFTELFNTMNGKIYFTFLNNYNNSIYFYDYNSLTFEKKITWKKDGQEGILGLTGYHIKSLDSIYLFDKSKTEIILSNCKNIILNKISLRGSKNDLNWFLHYPQYYPQAVKPFIQTAHEIIFSGFFPGNIPESIISDFKFTARLDFNTNKVKFSNTYPKALYGNNYNWNEEFFKEVFSDLHPDGDKLVLSFPISHDLYLVNLNTGEYTKVYGGSNFAGAISSINKQPKKTSKDEVVLHAVRNDEYSAIKYDKFRKVYYRFLLKAIPQAPINTEWKEKPVAVIIMDENFRYLGETVIGKIKNWNWQDSFVTSEGLNIEYIEKNVSEKYLTLKIFTIKKI